MMMVTTEEDKIKGRGNVSLDDLRCAVRWYKNHGMDNSKETLILRNEIRKRTSNR